MSQALAIMSATGATRSSITPDFVYILQIRQHHHVLRPGDQKSADFIVLVKTVIDDIEAVKNLFAERGPFLVDEKQQIMRDVIDDTEDAIERVIRVLNPARIEQISEESIRVNTKNPYTLQSDDPKSGATFGRLQIANNRLGIVLHDLRNIEATAQLDSCEIRATTSVRTPPSRPEDLIVQDNPSMDFNPIHGQHETVQAQRTKEFVQSLRANPPQEDITTTREGYSQGSSDTYQLAQSDPKTLLAWKRSRRGSRNTNSSAASSVSGTNPDDQDTSDPRTPSSIPEPTLMPSPLDLSTRASKDSRSYSNTMHQQELSAEGRLPVIPELEGTSVSNKAASQSYRQKQAQSDAHEDMRSTPSKSHLHNKEHTSHDQTQASQRQTSGPVSSSRGIEDPALVSEQSTEPGYQRTTFASYKRRHREKSRGELPTTMDMMVGESHISEDRWQSSPDEAQETHMHQNNFRRLETNFRSTPGRVHDPTPQTALVASPLNPGESLNKFASRPSPERQQLGSHIPSQLFTPSRMNGSPQTQTLTSAGQRMQDVPSLYIEPPDKAYGTQKVETGVARVPTLLRAGQKKEELQYTFANKPPYPVSDTGSDNEEGDHLTELRHPHRPRNTDRSATVPPATIGVRHVATALPTLRPISGNFPSQVERSITVPLDSQRPMHAAPIAFPNVQSGDRPHQRSYSSNDLGQGLVRTPTVPRKPVPYQTSNLFDASAENRVSQAPVDGIRAARPRPVSEIFPYPKLNQGRNSDTFQSSVYESPPTTSTHHQQDQTLLKLQPAEHLSFSKVVSRQDDDFEDAQSRISSRMSSFSSRGFSLNGSDQPLGQSSEQKNVAKIPLETNGVRTNIAPDAVELPVKPMSPTTAESVLTTSLKVMPDSIGLSERMQFQNPLRMHPIMESPKTAYETQLATVNSIEAKPSVGETNERSAVLLRSTNDILPTANLTFVPTALSLLNVDGAGQSDRSRHPNRSRTTPEPVSQPESNDQSLLHAPRRASAQGSIESGSQRPIVDPRSGSNVLNHSLTESKVASIVSEPQMVYGPPNLAASRLMHSTKPGHEPSAFQAQNHLNGMQPVSMAQVGSNAQQKDSSVEPSKEHILPFMSQQSPPRQHQEGRTPMGHLTDQRVHSYPQQPQFDIQQPWELTVLPPGMHPMRAHPPPQHLQLISEHTHPMHVPNGPFIGSMQQHPNMPPQTAQPLYQTQFQQYSQYQIPIQYQGPPQFHVQPLPSPGLPVQSPPLMPMMQPMQPMQQQWNAPALAYSNGQFNQPGFYQQPFQPHQIPPPQMSRPSPLPPLGAKGEYSLQQISPVQPPSQLAKPPKNPAFQDSPIQQSPPPVLPRPMSYTSTHSQGKYQNGDIPLTKLPSSGLVQSAPQTRPLTPVQNPVISGSYHKADSSTVPNTEFAAGLSSPSVPSLSYMPSTISATPSQIKNKRSTWLHHQVSKMKN